MPQKALLIQSYTALQGTQGQWNDLTQATSYIQGIETGDILSDVNAQTLGALISGVPSPWARAKLFKYALDTLNAPNPNISKGGLLNYYTLLEGEWRGLMAVIALFPDRIRFSAPVTMDTRGEDYQIAPALGRMLFDEADLWTDQDALQTDPDAQPYLHLIYYNGKLVGGTSPLTGVFTGVNYSNLEIGDAEVNWYRNGKFEDPTPYLSSKQLQKLYLFIRNLNSNVAAFEHTVNSRRQGRPQVDLAGFKGRSRQWESELEAKGGPGLLKVGPVAKYAGLRTPFRQLMDSNVPVYRSLNTGLLSYTDDGNSVSIGDIQNLLSPDPYVVGWVENKAQRPKLSDGPVYYVRQTDVQTGDTYYFTIPLSEQGLDLFQGQLGSLLGYKTDSPTRLTARVNPASGRLLVSLVVQIDGQMVALNDREYTVDWMQSPGRVILWPDFVSDKWNRYYLYNEFTQDAQEQFSPIFRYGGKILRDIDNRFLTHPYAPAPGEKKQVTIKQLAKYPVGQGEGLPRYDILAADRPVFALHATVKEAGRPCGAGFLVLKMGDAVEDLTTKDPSREVTVGIDFGSNNTCMFYKQDERTEQPIEFQNCRTVMVGYENPDSRAIAENNELLFFTNYPSEDGQLKSWLHEHDSRYVQFSQRDEVSGGVPVNRPNVRVVKMTPFEITTQAGILHYNMKWLDDDKGRDKKAAYLKSVWLQACAYLYRQGFRPDKIVWSFPGSMMESDRVELSGIFSQLAKVTPYGREPDIDEARHTESQAVCAYALTGLQVSLNRDNMYLGIDVGGSTSDILLIAKNPRQQNLPWLYRESSVRLAAGVFFDTVIRSEQFREALLKFHEGHDTDVHVENIQEVLTDPAKAPYYLNSIFDQLKTEEDYQRFYDSLASNARFVFAIPAYVCGLLLFYSGMLVAKAIKDNGLEEIAKVDLAPFGKGGRIFHWLRHAISTSYARQYYRDCVNGGVDVILPGKTLEVNYRAEAEEKTKTEVARGLTCLEQTQMGGVDANRSDCDICGEEGVTFLMDDGTRAVIAVDDEMAGDHFEDLNRLDFSGARSFERFMEIFVDFVSRKTKLFPKGAEALREDLADLPSRVGSFCSNDPEYKKAARNAREGMGFHYHQPVIIAEGACFLKALITRIFGK